MSAFDFAILGVVFVGTLWIVISVIDDVVHRRRLRREGAELAEVYYLDDHFNDPCISCGHPRQAHYLRSRRHARGACQLHACLCASYTPDRGELEEAR